MTEGNTFTVGDTSRWIETVTDCPAPSWTLKCVLRGPGALTVTAAPSGSDHLFTLTAAQSATLPAGLYRASFVATSGDEVFTVKTSVVNFLPNMATVAAGSQTFHADTMYRAICAVLEGRITADVEAHTIQGVSITKIPFERLYALKAKYAREVYALHHGHTPRTITYSL